MHHRDSGTGLRRRNNEGGRQRRLLIELLEERRVLDAASPASLGTAEPAASLEKPWQNDVYRLDVNNDGVTSTNDLLVVINAILNGKTGALPVPPSEPVELFYDTNGDNRLTFADLLGIVNGLLQPPVVETTTLTNFTVDVTPQVTVKTTVAGTGQLPDGTTVFLDVDLNNDGDFADPGEMAHTQSTLYQGQSVFSLTPALARDNTATYTVQLRARVQNSNGVFGRSDALPLVVDTLTSDALANYVYSPDPSYGYAPFPSETRTTLLGSYTYYAIDMTSQTWRTADEVNLPVWHHWLTMYVPSVQTSNTAMLLIDGGNNQNFDTPPGAIDLLGQAAVSLGTVVVHLSDVPSEPLVFADETSGRSEDAIIAYSFDKFMNNIGQPGNDTWPVLVAMVKSAVRAMDTAQAMVPSLTDFVVTGYSKRGWTTWLTAAVDNRVRAIIPGVFDNLNQGPQMVHHYGAYGFFSPAVQDYNDKHIFDRIISPAGELLSQIVDPYRYLNNGRFDNMPKLLINSAGDEFFNSDSAQFYFDDIPGDQNYLIYLPNTGHGLDINLNDPNSSASQVASSTLTFVNAILNNDPLPKYSWTVGQDGAIRVETDTTPLEVRLWHADNPVAHDFRHAYNPGISWTYETLNPTAPGVYVGNVDMPDSGARAYFVQLIYPNTSGSVIPVVSDPYVFTTEIRIKSTLPLYPWPYETAFGDGAPLTAIATALVTEAPLAPLENGSVNAVASALALEQESFDGLDDEADLTLPPPAVEPSALKSVVSSSASPVELGGPPKPSIAKTASEDFLDSLVDDALLELLA